MPIFARWRPLGNLPARVGRDALPGVYEIADEHKRTVYLGQSSRDVPNRIRQHLARGGCVASCAVYWRMAYSRVPQADEAELITSYRKAHGDLPPCNGATPLRRDARRRWSERSRGCD